MKTSLGDRLLYAIGGSIGSNIGFQIMSIFFIMYCVDVWEMNPVAAGTIIMVARLVDTFTDPIMGAIADKTRTRLGKYRFWIIVAGPFTGLLVFLVFAGPNIPVGLRLLYMYIVYIAYSIISTAANIPYHSLTAYITSDPNERRVLVVIKQFTAMVVATLLQVVGITIVIQIFGGTAGGFRAFGAICGILVAVGFMACGFGARKVDNGETVALEPDSGEKINIKSLFTQTAYIFKTPSLRMITVASSTNMFASAITQSIGIYFFAYVLGSANYAQVNAVILLGLTLLTMPLTMALSKKYGNKEVFTVSSALALLAGTIVYFMFNGEAPALMLAYLAIPTFFANIGGLILWMMVNDCADDIKYETGNNGAGIASSCLTFANKLGAALGGFCTGLVLAGIGYVAGAESQPESVQNGLLAVYIFAPVLGHVFSVVAMKWYPLSKVRHAQIQEELYGRRAEAK